MLAEGDEIRIRDLRARDARGLGQIEQAKPHIGQWSNRDIMVPDPRQERLDLVLESGLSYELRGIRAFEARRKTQFPWYF